jgi:molybdenum cofactor synthesis domain-containing protein
VWDTVRRTFEYSSPEEALSRVIELVQLQHPESESVEVREAFGRVLDDDILAGINLPEYDSSRFDGFAVRSKDTSGASRSNPVSLKNKGKIQLGERVNLKLGKGETCRIPTGGFLPSRADAVVMLERVTSPSRETIEIDHPVNIGVNIIKKGEDAKRGEKILSKGKILRAQDIGLLTALGIRRVSVFGRPKIPIISTGSELVEYVDEKKEGNVFQSHSYMVSKLVERLGGIPIDLGIVSDDIPLLSRKIIEGLEEGELVITIGGCSVGDHDYVPDAIKQAGKHVDIIQGVKRRPGRVSGVGVVDGKPIAMLPGHIQSAFIGFHLFVIPLIQKISGTSGKELQITVKAKLSESVKFRRSGEFEKAIFVRLDRRLEDWIAKPMMGDSSLYRILVEADGFTVIPSGKKRLEKGEEVNVNLVTGFSWV